MTHPPSSFPAQSPHPSAADRQRPESEWATVPTHANPPHPTHPHHHEPAAQRHGHVHSEASLRQIVNRLSRIEGHIRGIKTMVQESRPCPDVLIQIAAVRGAIDRVARLILDAHLTECVARAAKEGNIEMELEELKAALDRFLP
ncbi:metal-sensing transcriptional repressor [Trichothermofontia sp.]